MFSAKLSARATPRPKRSRASRTILALFPDQCAHPRVIDDVIQHGRHDIGVNLGHQAVDELGRLVR